LKLDNDKLKDKIQEICAELSNLRDEVKAERNGSHAISSEGTDEGNSKAIPNSIQEDFRKYFNGRMSPIGKSLEHLSSQVDKISASLDQALEYSYPYNIEACGRS